MGPGAATRSREQELAVAVANQEVPVVEWYDTLEPKGRQRGAPPST
jgi:hypothetical protein